MGLAIKGEVRVSGSRVISLHSLNSGWLSSGGGGGPWHISSFPKEHRAAHWTPTSHHGWPWQRAPGLPLSLQVHPRPRFATQENHSHQRCCNNSKPWSLWNCTNSSQPLCCEPWSPPTRIHPPVSCTVAAIHLWGNGRSVERRQ